ncbi:MAG TPA: two-component regulator propeller domain-containing protein, partial [Candidatus Polarisedimenticolia bacterium]|nr:two-component regulator propeller domain-containing protein [Candidatus Polarisedimenticolia bacterium]
MLTNCRVIGAALLLLCGLFPGFLRASQPDVQSGSPFVVDVWSAANGLPDDSVLSLVQTRDGYLWVGTLHGLVRFDGMRFTPFDETGSLGLASSRIVHLFEDSRSNLWVGTESSGIVLAKKNGQIEHFPFGQGMPGGYLSSATEDQNGTIWMRLLNGMIARYSSNKVETVSGPFKAVIAEKNGPLWLATDSELFPILAPAGSAAMIVQQQLQVPVQNCQFLLAGKTEGYWRFAGGRVQKWKINQLQRDLGPYPWGSTPITAACEDDHGNLIVGTYGDGVYWFDANGKFTHILNELTHGSVLSLAFDSEGNLWVGTNGRGLNRVKRRAFSVLPVSKDLVVQSVSPEKNGGLWIAYNGNRVDHWSNGVSEQFSLVQDPRIAVGAYAKSVLAAKDGRVFAGVSSIPGQRLFEWDGKKFAPASVEIDSDISAIYQDRAGRIWIGTQAGLFLLEGHDLKQFKEGLPSLDVSAIADDADGNLWIGTSGGLACLRDGKFTSFHKKDGLPSEEISSLLVDADGVLWIGTRGSGLARFFKNQWTHYTTAQGLAGNSIGYLAEDNETNLWLGSNTGLMRVAKKSLNDFANGTAHDINCRVYLENDGLPTRECTEGSQPAACATANGTFWFPTTHGLVYVNPATLKQNLREPRVVIESVWVEDQRQNTNRLDNSVSEVVVPPGKGHLDIYYASLNLGAADRSRFRYRLKEGDDTPWTDDKSGNRVAGYEKLPPGTYQFEVTACNEDGVWNYSHPAELTIVMQPALWQKAWFRASIAAALIAAIAGLVYYFSTQKLQRQVAILRQQEALEQERARIARDLHDQLGANLTQMALLAEMAETDKNIPAEVEDHARQITQTARETTKALDEIVWAVNPSNDTLEGLVNYSGKYAQEYFALAHLRYRVDIPSSLPEVTLPPEVRHNIFLAFKESVNNVVKHAQATEVHMRLKLEQQNVVIEIEDNGRGPGGAAQKTGRNGLRNMRKRMEDVGGNFSIGPAPEQGTIVRLS